MGGNGYFWKVALIVWFLNSNRSTWVTLHDLSVFRQDLGQRAWVLLVEVLHGVDPGIVRDLLQPPHRPGNVIENCANCFSWKFCFDGQLHLKWSTFKPPKRTCIVAIVQVHFWKGHIYWCVYTKSHQLIEKTCQQDRPSPSKDSGPPQPAWPWPCTEDRAAPGETKLLKVAVHNLKFVLNGGCWVHLVKKFWYLWPCDVGEVDRPTNSWWRLLVQ